MLQDRHDPDGKPVPARASAGRRRGPGVTDGDERKAAAAPPGTDPAPDAPGAPREAP